MSIHVAWIHCECGKLHATAGMRRESTCTCGRRLMPMGWDLNHLRPPTTQGDPVTPIAVVAEQKTTLERLAAELERLGTGIERIAAKHGADHSVVAKALHDLLRGR